MKTRIITAIAVSLSVMGALGVMGAASAQQSTIVVGHSAAANCYQHAVQQRSDQMALRDCDSALRDNRTGRADRKKTLVNRSVILLRMGRPEQALADLEAATRLRFDPPEVFLNYSAAYIRLGRNREAIAAATEAIERGFHRPQQAHFNRAVAYENIGDLPAATADYRQASQLAPEWLPPQRELERFTVNNGS